MHIVIPHFLGVSCSCGFNQVLQLKDTDKSEMEIYSIFLDLAQQHASAYRPSIIVRIELTE